jgi:tRNA-splicing ligase RtcB
MEWVNAENKVPIKSWCKDVDDNALEQAVNLANHPAVVRHVALMPDCHLGYGMPIGGVIGCKGAVIPNAVGVDIGCGMATVPTNYPADELTEDQIKAILGEIRNQIPVGFKHHIEPQEWDGFEWAPQIPIIQQELESARCQIGTLGGGNHFIEIQRSDTGHVYLMLHSGSRNFGFKVAHTYHKKALELCNRWFADIPDKELAFLPTDDHAAHEYIKAMEYALDFAAANRSKMLAAAKGIAFEILGCGFGDEINIHHNYAAMENHFGRNLLIHRKGATSAREDQLGIIPGSMGTPSYIVRGLGNPDSFTSCSHGAGRVMGRKEASRRLSLEECDSAMEGIVFGRWSKQRRGPGYDFGEAPQAYKDIDQVIAAQADLVEVVTRLEPLGVVKG